MEVIGQCDNAVLQGDETRFALLGAATAPRWLVGGKEGSVWSPHIARCVAALSMVPQLIFSASYSLVHFVEWIEFQNKDDWVRLTLACVQDYIAVPTNRFRLYS